MIAERFAQAVLGAAAVMVLLAAIAGCGGGGSYWEYMGNPYGEGTGGGGTTGPGGSATTPGGQLGTVDRSHVDPCTEPLSRKFVTISMRNHCQDYIHYFLVAIAFVDVDQTDPNATIPTLDDTQFPDGAVCPADIPLYTQFGYQFISAGQRQAFGDYCIGGPALVYFHRAGQFRTIAGGGPMSLGSAIAPAQGTIPTYDEFFTSAGAQIPVPDLIMWHNPGTGEGGALKISSPRLNPCDPGQTPSGAAICERDAFYYVDEGDLMSGSRQLGPNSGRRVPREIQGTGCECNPLHGAYHILAPSRVTATGAACDEFFRGGRILFAFVRDDRTPAFPQLLWRVTDAAGSIAHDFDRRAGLPGG